MKSAKLRICSGHYLGRRGGINGERWGNSVWFGLSTTSLLLGRLVNFPFPIILIGEYYRRACRVKTKRTCVAGSSEESRSGILGPKVGFRKESIGTWSLEENL